MLNRDTDYQRNNFLISKERITRQVIAGCWLSVFLAGVYLRKWDFLKPNTLDSSLFFEADFTVRNCFPRKKSPKCNIGSALLFVIYDKGERLVVKRQGTELHKTHQGIHLG